jgi:hypothetical protein
MIGKNIRYGFSIRLAALALATLCLTQFNLRAQELEPRGVAAAGRTTHELEQITFTYQKIEISPGQTLHLNLTYAVDPAQASRQPLAIRARAQFKDTSGNTIYISTAGGGVWKTINVGQSCSFDVNRDQLPLAGNPLTGGVAMVPELLIEAPSGVGSDLPTSLEVSDNLSGKVVFHSGNGTVVVGRNGNVYTVTFSGSLFHVSHGETLQVNLTNPLPLTLAVSPVAGGEWLWELEGINGESEAVQRGTIKPGQTIVAGFNRDQLPDAGEPGTGRLPLTVEITYRLTLTPAQFAALGNGPLFPVSFEFIDNQTGKISVYAPVTRTWVLRNSNTP